MSILNLIRHGAVDLPLVNSTFTVLETSKTYSSSFVNVVDACGISDKRYLFCTSNSNNTNANGGCSNIFWIDSSGSKVANRGNPSVSNAIYGGYPSSFRIDTTGTYAGIIYNSYDSSVTAVKYIALLDLNNNLYYNKFLYGYSATKLVVDASGNIYSTFDSGIGFIKIDNAGNLTMQYSLNNAPTMHGYDIALDSSGNIYVAGASGTTGIVVKYTAAGAVVWQRSYTTVSGSNNAYIEVSKSSGKIFLINDKTLFCLDASGNILWQKSGSTAYFYGVSVDYLDNVYTTSTGNIISKFDVSGNVIWQRTVTGEINGLGCRVDTITKSLFIFGAGSWTSSTFRVPLDGTKTGSYSGVAYGGGNQDRVYAAASLSFINNGYTSSPTSYTAASISNFSINSGGWGNFGSMSSVGFTNTMTSMII